MKSDSDKSKTVPKPDAQGTLAATAGSADRDGNWMDKWGACKVCDGEIPYGHTENCDLYKLERRTSLYEHLLRRVLEWCEQDNPNFEIDADAIRAALNPPNTVLYDPTAKPK
jgi:hypothetical protein